MFAMRPMFFLALFCALPAAVGKTETDRSFFVNDSNHRDTVRFTLNAPIEVINGISNTIDGTLQVSKGKLSGKFAVPVATIKTGNDTRDEHLQNDKWMNAPKFPKIEFEFKDVSAPESLWNGKEWKTKVKGKFAMHGEKKDADVELALTYLKESGETKSRLDGNLMKIRATTQLRLADYKIAQSDSQIKALLGLKVGEVAEVTVDAMGTDKKAQ